MQSIQFIGLDPTDFQKDLARTLHEVLVNFEDQRAVVATTEYLTRKEAAEMLNISESSLYRWTKNGRLYSYGIGNRVYYIRAEVEDALIPLNP